MKNILLLCLSGIVLFPRAAEARTRDDSVSVMSYNIRMSPANDGPNSWQYRKETTIAMFRDLKPDLVGMQEVVADQYDYVKENMPEYEMTGVGRDDGKRQGEIMAVMFKKTRFELLDSGHFWLSETPEQVSRGWDAACNRMVTWVKLKVKDSRKQIFFFNTHFDHMGKRARAESSKLVVAKIREIAGGKPFFLTGDFNAAPDNPVLCGLWKKNYCRPGRRRGPPT